MSDLKKNLQGENQDSLSGNLNEETIKNNTSEKASGEIGLSSQNSTSETDYSSDSKKTSGLEGESDKQNGDTLQSNLGTNSDKENSEEENSSEENSEEENSEELSVEQKFGKKKEDKKSKGESAKGLSGKKMILIGVGIIAIAAIGATIIKNSNNTTNQVEEVTEEVTEITTEQTVDYFQKEPEINIDEELAKIVDEVVGKENCTTKDKDELWELYLLDFQLENYAVYLDTEDDRLNAVIIAKPASGCDSAFNESISLLKSGFLGGSSDDTDVVLTDSYASQVGAYRIVTFGDNSKENGEKIVEKMKNLNLEE
jgi:hypothetical protein